MIIAKEVTVWEGAPNTPNHTYLLSDKKAKMYAYWNSIDGSYHVMSEKGVNFFATRRKFDIVNRNIESANDINSNGYLKSKENI